MKKTVSTSDATGLITLYEKLQSNEAKEAFAYLFMSFSRLPNCYCEPEAHGYASSLRVMDGEDWSFSFSSRQKWVLGYIRPPEIRKARITLADMQRNLPHTKDRGDEHFTVRLHNVDETIAFFKLVEASRH